MASDGHPLKKPRASESPNPSNAVSRTMQLAVRGAISQGDGTTLQKRGTWFSAPLAAAPRTKAEEYWAARALVAETLLSARDRRQAEVRRMEAREHERGIQAMLYATDQRQRRSERLMVMCLVILLGFMAWLAMMITPDRNASGKPSRGTHFTIPILSPFASVVEHETGVFGTKVIVVLIAVIGIGMYAASKHRWHA